MSQEESALRHVDTLKLAAWSRLNNSEELPPCLSDDPRFPGKPRLRIWDDAGGFNCPYEPMILTVYEVYMSDESVRFMLRQAVWQRTRDMLELLRLVERSGQAAANKPTIRVCDCAVPNAELRVLMKQGATLRLPVVCLDKLKSVSSNPGAVGFEYFGADSPPAIVRLQWSQETPVAWQPILNWFRELHGFLDSCIPEQGRLHRLTESVSRVRSATSPADPGNRS